MSRGSKSKTEGARSSLLSLQENERLEELLGRRCAVSPELMSFNQMADFRLFFF